MKYYENLHVVRLATMKLFLIILLFLQPGYATAENEIETLRKQLQDQRSLINEQSEMLKQQQHKIDQQAGELDRLGRRLDQMEKAGTAAPAQIEVQTKAAKTETAKAEAAPQLEPIERDPVGDMNAGAVKAGIFPGSFRIPGPGNVSLAIGGFVKAVTIYDSKAEKMGSDFLPATLGTKGQDEEGATSFDVTITRLFLDGRTPTPDGQVRGYVEYDLNANNNGSPDFKLRHAYGTWKNSYGTLTAGHTWSTAMDTKILPEGLTEPTVSGVVFVRQAHVRWSQPLGHGFTLHAAVEDPSSSDVSSSVAVNTYTTYPDGVLGIEYDHSGLWHLRLNGLVRDLKTDLPAGGKDSATAWVAALTGHLNVGEKDKLRFSGLYGEGLGRYFLGSDSSAGAIDPSGSRIELRKNWGVMAAYEHHWTDTLRSSIMGGYAHSKPLGWQPGGTLESSTYAAANLMWSIHRYITLGVEYAYGRRDNKDSSDLDNHRIGVGMQFY